MRPVKAIRKYPGEKLVKDRNSQFTEVEGQMANKPKKKGSTSPVVKEAPIAITMVPWLWVK